MKLKQESGFTLIELLVVLALLGILLAIAIPQFHKYKARARDMAVKGDLHNLYTACQAYWYDFGADTGCNAAVVAQNEYGFVQGARVVLTGGGPELVFSVTGSHVEGGNSFVLDSAGNIS